jgi:carboxyl-terminal processing protease
VGRRSLEKDWYSEMDFADGSAVRLTIARYYITGRSIQSPIRKAMRLTLRNQSLVLEMELYEKRQY